MAQEQTSYVGDDVEVVINVIDDTGAHTAATINTTTTRIHGNSAAPTVTSITTGIYKIVFSGVTPSPVEGDRLIVKINGVIDSTSAAWSEYGVPVKIVADERGTDGANTTAPDNTSVAAVKAVTDNLPDSGALSSLATASALTTVDTVVDAVKVKTDQLVFTVGGQVDANALTGGLSEAGVRSAVGLASANLDTQLSDIPTVAEFEARTLVSSAYFDPSADTVTTANASDVTAIKAKTDQFVFTVSNQVDSNALSGGDSGLDAAGVRSAIGLSSANLDTQLSDIPTVSDILAAGDVDGYSLEETLKLCLAVLAGKISGAGTGTITIRSADDSRNRIVATTDNDGNRLSITLDKDG